MNTVKLIKLTFDNRLIEFKDGVNYIFGLNASGKTTIFKLISFALGLKKDLGFFTSFLEEDVVSLEILISNKHYLFKRNLSNREIQIVYLNEDQFFNVSSVQFNRYLNQIFQPKYEYEVNDSVITSLLSESFVSDISDINILNTSQKELKLLLLGVNAFYPKKIRNYLKELKIQVNQKEDALSQVKSYKNDIEFLLFRQFSDKQSIKEILQSTLEKYSTKIDEVLKVFNESKHFLQNLNEGNEHLYRVKQDSLNPIFKNYLQQLSIDDPVSINDVLEGAKTSSSYGRKTLIRLVFEIVLQSSPNITNGIGLIVNDAGLFSLETNMTYKLREFLHSISEDKQFQYIEFVNNTTGIKKSDIVFDISKSLKYA